MVGPRGCTVCQGYGSSVQGPGSRVQGPGSIVVVHFGCAESADLVQWSTPVMVRPFAAFLPEEDQPEHVWAPEIRWDPKAKDYFMLLAATTKRKRTEGDGSDNKGKNTSP